MGIVFTKDMAYTHGHYLYKTSTWLPCVDHGKRFYPLFFEISVRSNEMAICSGELLGSSSRDDSWKTFQYQVCII